jgi:hypothetical protein
MKKAEEVEAPTKREEKLLEAARLEQDNAQDAFKSDKKKMRDIRNFGLKKKKSVEVGLLEILGAQRLKHAVYDPDTTPPDINFAKRHGVVFT